MSSGTIDPDPASDAQRRLLATLRDPARLAAIRATGLLADERVEALERVARLAAVGLRAPLAQVNLVTDAAQVPVAAHVVPPHIPDDWRTPVELSRSYCQHVVGDGAPLLIDDAPTHPRVRDNAATRDAGIGAYLGVPLRTPDAQLLGSLCVVDFEPRAWSAADLLVLDDLAAVASLEIALRAAGRAASDEASHAVDRTERLQRLSDDLARPLTRAEAARLILAHVADAMGASGGGVFERQPDDGALVLLEAIGYRDVVRREHARLDADSRTPAAEAARHARPVLVGSRAAWDAAGYQAPMEGPIGVGDAPGGAAAAWAALPLMVDDRVLGVLALTFVTPRAFDAAERAFMLAYARQCALALERARLLDAERAARADAEAARAEAERAVSRAERLQAVTAALSGALTPRDVVVAVVREGLMTAGARAGAVLELVDGGRTWRPVHTVGFPAHTAQAHTDFPVDVPVPVRDVARTGEPVFLGTRDAWAAAGYDTRPLLPDSGAWAALPLRRDGAVVGALTASFAGPHAFAPDERAFLLALASLCAQAMERARLFEAERAARAHAEEASRAKSDFLNVLSHELRSPANAIIGHAQLLELGIHGPVTPEQHDALARIARSAHLMAALVNDLLNLARIEQGRLSYELQDVSVAEALDTVAGVMRPQVEAKALTLDVQPGPPGLVVRADSERLQQILINLLTNAIKFTERGALSLSARVEGARVCIAVRDTGIGIPAEKLPTVFDRFVQVDPSLTRRAGGMGLGLAIARDLARAMDGDLTASSVVGEGSTFTLLLPLVR
ncbi:GAF domain-containing protein [Roseisolibacter agri]|nr:GAF domain-containing protein [Roseisolibacter agri]